MTVNFRLKNQTGITMTTYLFNRARVLAIPMLKLVSLSQCHLHQRKELSERQKNKTKQKTKPLETSLKYLPCKGVIVD